MDASSYAVLIFLALAFGERVAHSLARRETVRGELRMRWSLYVLYSLYTAVVLGSLVEHLCLRRSTLLLGWSLLGLALFVASVCLRYIAVRTLGQFWSLQVEIRDQHQLVDSGVYRYVRHPIYSSIVLEIIAIPLVANAWWTLALASTAHLAALLLRLRREEREMINQLGTRYIEYQQRTGALFPRLGKRSNAKDLVSRSS